MTLVVYFVLQEQVSEAFEVVSGECTWNQINVAQSALNMGPGECGIVLPRDQTDRR